MAIQNYAFKSIGSFLQDNTYYIPDYQREYSWEESQVEDFWNDLKTLREYNEEEHFFGQIVVQDEKEEKTSKKFIIDGQQRSITSVIFLSALSEVCNSLDEQGCFEAQEIVEDIKIKYIGRWSPNNDRLQLRIANSDNEFFRAFVQTRSTVTPDVQPLTKAQKRIEKSYKYLLNQLNSEIEGLNPDESFLIINEYYKSFINGFKVMYVETTSLEEAFIIFESLNARGRGLETSDLLKNHLFKVSKAQIDTVKRKWESMVNNLDGNDATRFIRYYWNSREEFVRTQNLYKRMKNQINSPGESLKIVTHLDKLAPVYNSISQKDGVTVFNSEKLNETIKNLKVFGASSYYPIVLAMYNKDWDEEHMLKVLGQIEILIFRNIIIASNVANKYEVLFAGWARGIANDELGVSDIVNRINKEKISDEEFSSYMERLVIKNKPIIRYIFSKINSLYSSGETIISTSENVHIEHIMPVNLSNEWTIEEEIHQENLWKLGNLTLLGKEYNKKIQNKGFSTKKQMYKDSEISITRQLLNYEEWDVSTIEERQSGLREDAMRIW